MEGLLIEVDRLLNCARETFIHHSGRVWIEQRQTLREGSRGGHRGLKPSYWACIRLDNELLTSAQTFQQSGEIPSCFRFGDVSDGHSDMLLLVSFGILD